ncbi:MAG: hypothetical protein JEY91_15110 [Spirochaetaceae bacterium]|nr:hypothetical protein [Spirochaetaceae bacterium]
MKLKCILSLIFSILLFSPLFSEDEKPIMEATIGLGYGFYVGSFLDHLNKDGAYTSTPTLDSYFASYITPFLGFQFQIGCGSVIHPLSEPMEGVILYMGLGPFINLNLKKVYIKTWVDAGFQFPTMSLQWYGSGFLEIGSGFGLNLNKSNSLVLSLKYRTQFLRSIIISKMYDSIDENDNLSSITLSFGWSTRLY